MTSFTFSAEELKSAPDAVRAWLIGHVDTALRSVAAVPPEPAQKHVASLAACTLEEAVRVFELIKNDIATLQVFLELGREPSLDRFERPLHALSVADVIRYTRLDAGQLIASLQAINAAFQHVSGDPEASLFGFDQANHIYLHPATHQSVRTLWEQLVASRPSGMPLPAEIPLEPGPQPMPQPGPGFLPPRLGPSEDIAAHRPI